MGGIDALNNILLICMTNRKDMVDPAILRPGRLEAHVEIGLPDEKGRVQIFQIHTKQMRESGLLDPTVDIPHLASVTKNYSGAEIEGVCKAALSFAFEREIGGLDSYGAGQKGHRPAAALDPRICITPDD